MDSLPKTALYIGLCVVASIWISGCWNSVDKLIEKNPFKTEQKSQGLMLFPNFPNIPLPQNNNLQKKDIEQNLSNNS
jgi:hypothetical protein